MEDTEVQPTFTSSYWEWSAALARGPRQQWQDVPRGYLNVLNHPAALDQQESTRMMINTGENSKMESHEDDEISDFEHQILHKLNFNDDLCLNFPEFENTGTAFEPVIDQLQYLVPTTECETVYNSLGLCTPVDPVASMALPPEVHDSLGKRKIEFEDQNSVNPGGSSDIDLEDVRNELRKYLGNFSPVEPHDQKETFLFENNSDTGNFVVPESEHGFSVSEIENFKRDLERTLEFQNFHKEQLLITEERINALRKVLRKVLGKDADYHAFNNADDPESKDIDIIRKREMNEFKIIDVASCSGHPYEKALSSESLPKGSDIDSNRSVRNKLRKVLSQESQQYWAPKPQSRRNSGSVNESLARGKPSDEVSGSRTAKISQEEEVKDGFEISTASSTVNIVENDAMCPSTLNQITNLKHGLQLVAPTTQANEAHLVLCTNARQDSTSAPSELVSSDPLNSKGPNQFDKGLKELRSSIFQCITDLQGDIQTLKTRIGDILIPYTNESSRELQALSLLIKGVQETSESSVNQDIRVEVLSSDTLSTLQNFTDELEKELNYLIELRKRSSINQNEHSTEGICKPSIKSDNLRNSVAVNNIQGSEKISKGNADYAVEYFPPALKDDQAVSRNDNIKWNGNDNTQKGILKNGSSGLDVRSDESRSKIESCIPEPGPISGNQYEFVHKFDKSLPSDSLWSPSASIPIILHEFVHELDQELTKRVHEYDRESKKLNSSLIPEDLLQETSSVITKHLERDEQFEPSISIHNDIDEIQNTVPPDASHIAVQLNAVSADMLSTLMGFVDDLHQELRRNINQRSSEAQNGVHNPEAYHVTQSVDIITPAGLCDVRSRAGDLDHRVDGHLETHPTCMKCVDVEDADVIPLEETEYKLPLSQLSMHTLCMLERFIDNLYQEFKSQILLRNDFVGDSEGQNPSKLRTDQKPKKGRVSLIHSYQRSHNFRKEDKLEVLPGKASPISKLNIPEISVDALSTNTLRVLKELMREIENELQKCTIHSHKMLKSIHPSRPKISYLSDSHSTAKVPVLHETNLKSQTILSNDGSMLDVEKHVLISNNGKAKDSTCQSNDLKFLMTPNSSIFETPLCFSKSFMINNTLEPHYESKFPADSRRTLSNVSGMSPNIYSIPNNLLIKNFGGQLEALIKRCTQELKNDISCFNDKINKKDVCEPRSPSLSLLPSWEPMVSAKIEGVIGPLLEDLKTTLLDELSAFESKERNGSSLNALAQRSLRNLTQAQKLSIEEEQITNDIVKDTDSAHKSFVDESHYLKKKSDFGDDCNLDNAAQVNERNVLDSLKRNGHDCKAKNMDSKYKYEFKDAEPATISDGEAVISNLLNEVHKTPFAGDAKLGEDANFKTASGSGNDNLFVFFANSEYENSQANKGNRDQEKNSATLSIDQCPMKYIIYTDSEDDQQGERKQDISAERHYETKTEQGRIPLTKGYRSNSEKVVPALQAKLGDKRGNSKVILHIRRVMLSFLELLSCGLTDCNKTSRLSEYGKSMCFILSKSKAYRLMRWTIQNFHGCSPGTLTDSSLKTKPDSFHKFVDKGINVSFERHWDKDWDDAIALDLGLQVDSEPTNLMMTTSYPREIYNRRRNVSDFRSVAIDHDNQRDGSSLIDQDLLENKLGSLNKLRDIYVAHDLNIERPRIWTSKTLTAKKADIQKLAKSFFTI